MLIWLLIIINLLICAWDSYAAGFLWSASKNRFDKLISGCAMVIGTVGMLYTMILIGVAIGILGEPFLIGTNVILGFPIIMAGIVITIHGCRQAIKERNFLGGAISVWNTFAIIHDIRVWVKSFEVFKDIGISGMFKGNGDSKGKAALFLVIAILLTALISIGLFNAGRKKEKELSEISNLKEKGVIGNKNK